MAAAAVLLVSCSERSKSTTGEDVDVPRTAGVEDAEFRVEPVGEALTSTFCCLRSTTTRYKETCSSNDQTFRPTHLIKPLRNCFKIVINRQNIKENPFVLS